MAKTLRNSCVLILVVVMPAALSFVLIHLRGTWDPDAKAWSRLPPDTRWAAEIHDLGGLLAAATRDPGVPSLLSEYDTDNILGTRTLAFLAKTGPLFSVIAPNAGIVGACDFKPTKAFLIFQPPVWMRYLGYALEWDGGEIQSHAIDNGIDNGDTIYFILHDKWMIASMRADVVQHVLDGWDSGCALLGPGEERTEPYCYFAFADEGRTSASARLAGNASGQSAPANAPVNANANAPAPSHFAFADPFAAARSGSAAPDSAAKGTANGAVESAADDMADDRTARFLLTPSEEGWEIRGEAAVASGFGTERNGDNGLARLAELIPEEMTQGERALRQAPPAPFALAVSARISPGAKAAFLSSIPPSSRRAASVKDAFLHFLRSAWLDNTGEAWSLLAGEPPAPARDDAAAVAAFRHPYPPLPLFALGWTLPTGIDPVRAADAFSDGLAGILESLRRQTGDDSPLARGLLETISISPIGSRTGSPIDPQSASGGLLRIPPLLVNAARPAWRFDRAASPPAGWLATDPQCFPLLDSGADAGSAPRMPDMPSAASASLPPPEANHARVRAGWDFRNEFPASLSAVIEDRLRNAFDPGGNAADGNAAAAEKTCRFLRRFAEHFPQGRLSGDVDAKNRRLVFKAAVRRNE